MVSLQPIRELWTQRDRVQIPLLTVDLPIMSDTASVNDPDPLAQCVRCVKLKAVCEPPAVDKPNASCAKCTKDKAKDCTLRVQKRKYVSNNRSKKKAKTDSALAISQDQYQQIDQHLKTLNQFFAPKEEGIAKDLWNEHYGKLVKLLAPAQKED